MSEVTANDLTEEIRAHFELQGLAIAQLPDTLTLQLSQAAQVLADALVQGNKIFAVGQGDAQSATGAFIQELADSSSIERPAFPGILLHVEEAPSQLERRLRSLAQPGDVMLLVLGSRQGRNHTAELAQHLCSLAHSQGMGRIFIGDTELPGPPDVGCIELSIVQGTRMNYLCSISLLTMTLVSLIDFQVFGHSLSQA